MRKLLSALAICLAAGCSKQGGDPVVASPAPTPAPPPKLLVLATIAPMYCLTKNIAGDLADVEMIVPPGVSPRGFQPSADEVQRIMQADVIVENGYGFEDWMDRLAERGLKPGAERVIAERGTGPAIPGLPGNPNAPPGDAPADPSKPADPHVWLDPLMAIVEMQNILDALMKKDPAHAIDYFTNESRYETTLRDLDDEVGRSTVDLTRRRILCVTDTFTYFLSRYEFTVAGEVDTPAQAPAAAKDADAVLVPKGTDAAILNGSGLRVVIADPMESGPASTDFYEQVTRANTQALREGLWQ